MGPMNSKVRTMVSEDPMKGRTESLDPWETESNSSLDELITAMSGLAFPSDTPVLEQPSESTIDVQSINMSTPKTPNDVNTGTPNALPNVGGNQPRRAEQDITPTANRLIAQGFKRNFGTTSVEKDSIPIILGSDTYTTVQYHLVNVQHTYHGPKFKRFLDLPRELRDAIYTFAMEGLPTRTNLHNGVKISPRVLYPNLLPNICFTSKQVRVEATLAYIRRTRFVIQPDDYAYPVFSEMSGFLSQFPDETGFGAIRMLYYAGTMVRYLTGFSDSGTPDGFLTRCTGLRSLIMEVNADMCSDMDYSKEKRDLIASLWTDTRIRARTGIASLCTLGNLRHLKIVGIKYALVQKALGLNVPDDIFAKFMNILWDGFAARKANIKLEFVCDEFQKN